MEKRGISSTLIGLNSAMAGLASMVAASFTTKFAHRHGVAPDDALGRPARRNQRLRLLLHHQLLALVSAARRLPWRHHRTLHPLRVLDQRHRPAERNGASSSASTARSCRLGFLSRAAALLDPRQRGRPALRASAPASFCSPPCRSSSRGTKALSSTKSPTAISCATSSWCRPRPPPSSSSARSNWAGCRSFRSTGHDQGFTELQAALLLTVMGIGNFIFQIPLGMLSDQHQGPAHICWLR